MPHYQDGSEAKVGDVVVGRTYNQKGACIGVVTSITPDQESCNCQVERVLSMHGNSVLPASGTDYGETKAFLRVEAPPEATDPE